MVRKNKIGRMLRKVGIRTIFSQWLQFLSIILINAVAVTLFVGLCSNADSIEKRVNTLYEGSNIADIWTSVTISDDQDSEAIDKIVGLLGKTEKRYSLDADIDGNPYNALMSESLPTINAAYNTDNVQQTDFFIIDNRLFNDERQPQMWDKWVDEEGYYRSKTVSFNFSAVHNVLEEYTVEKVLQEQNEDYYDRIENIINNLPDGFGEEFKKSWNDLKNKNMIDVFNTCLIDENSVNIFDQSTLDLSFQVTGSMMFAENIQSSLMNTSNFLLDINLFKNKLKQSAYENFANPEVPQIGDEDYLWKLAIRESNILEGVIDMIADSYTYNTYCTKLNDLNYLDLVKTSIQQYFNNKEENNLIMCNDIDSLVSNITIQNDIIQARQLAYFFPIVFFLVATLVAITTFSQLIIKERTLIGTLKAMGISKTRIIVHYLSITSIITLIGAVIGIIIGPLLLSFILNIKYAILYTLPPMTYTLAFKEASISTLGSIAISNLVTFLVVYKGVKLSPSEAMRPVAPKSIKTKAVGNAKKPLLLAIKMAFRNIRVNITKSLMVVVGIMGCTALLVCGFGIDDTLVYGVEHDIAQYYSADISLSYNDVKSHKDEILAIDGVDSVEEYALLPSTIRGQATLFDTKVFCIENDSQFFIGDDGYQIKEDIAISQKEAEALNLKVGDIIEFSVPLVRKEYFVGRVGAIFENFYIHGIFVNKDFMDYGEIFEFQNNGWVSVTDYNEAVNIGEQIKQIEGIAGYTTRDENRDTINSYMSSISVMTLAVKCFAIILAVVVLYNLALLNFKERNRDIATMKVLGFNQLEIMMSLIIEIMVLTTIGILLGLLLGKPLEVAVLMVNRTPLVEFLYTVFPKTYLISFAITFGTSLFVNFILSLKARGVKMVESLKSVD